MAELAPPDRAGARPFEGCGTAAEVVAVTEIDFRKIGCGTMGPVTRMLQKEFFSTVHGQGRRSDEWLDYVSA